MRPFRGAAVDGLVSLWLVCAVVGFAGAQSASVGIAAQADVTVTTAATLVSGGNAFRDALSCTNHSTTINVRWGDSTVTATKGQRIPAGGAAEIRNRGPIYMIAESSTAVVSCTEETR